MGTSLVTQTVKHLPTMRETWIQSLGWEDPLEKGRATHSSIVAWRIPWTEDPGRLQSMGMQRVRHNWVTKPSPAQHKDTHVTFHKEHCSAGFFSCDVFVRPQCQSNNDQICRSYDMFFSVDCYPQLGIKAFELKLRARGEGGNRGWEGWTASLTRWTWVSASSRIWWWTGKPGILQSMGLQRVRHDWATELNWTKCNDIFVWIYAPFLYYS